ncbi:hypothetical protein SNE40_019937 [Patella caerulea]|uniref:Uncharacterized protein n=1 Tax=Patella caerulea TaxID=87958 RepID=A0AAN8J111_PATCE
MMANLNSLRSLYNHSPKRLRELRELAEIMEQIVSKPEKALGTRWLQHKRSACNSLIKSYPVIVTHLENIAEDPLAKKDDQSKMKGYLSKLKSFKFVVYLLYFSEILEPLSKLSLLLQGSSIDLLFAMSCLDTFYTVLKDFSTNKFNGDLKELLESATNDPTDISFKGINIKYDKIAFENKSTNLERKSPN